MSSQPSEESRLAEWHQPETEEPIAAPTQPLCSEGTGPDPGRPRRSMKIDIIVIGLVVLIALAGLVGVKLYGAHSTGDFVEITGADGLDVMLPLDEDTRYVASTSLGSNTIVIENKTVHVEDADCKNKICEETGTIDTPGQTIICLPHKLVVKIIAGDGNDSAGFDAVSN